MVQSPNANRKVEKILFFFFKKSWKQEHGKKLSHSGFGIAQRSNGEDFPKFAPFTTRLHVLCFSMFIVYRTFGRGFLKYLPVLPELLLFPLLHPSAPSFPAGSATSPPRELTELSSELIYCISASHLILHLANNGGKG